MLDRAVTEAEVRDASVSTVAGFPYLRTTRFLSGFKNDFNSDYDTHQWILRLQQQDLKARQKEIYNLPTDDIENLARHLGEPADRQILQRRVALYSEKLLIHDQQQPDFYEALLKAVTDPSEYSTAMRVIGIYPVTSMPVTAVTRNVQKKFRNWHHTPPGKLEVLGELTTYRPSSGMNYSEETVRILLNRSRQNALRIPQPSVPDQKTLLEMFAPVINQDVAADYDNIGEVRWQDNKVVINPAEPTVYYYISRARLKGVPVLQLNYVFWYSARSGPNSPRIERGLIDGLTVRVSIDFDGRPFMVDIMNNCGCYHFFIPHLTKIGKMIPTPDGIDAFVPRRLPKSYPRKPLTLRVVSGWHQVAHVNDETNAAKSMSYRLAAYEKLEMLPHENQSFESIFNSAGIGKGTGRIEPLIFFPMGIVDIGSMRQRGHHAIKLVGREHFDDPNLFDRNFEIR